jgi:hypothetical protein
MSLRTSITENILGHYISEESYNNVLIYIIASLLFMVCVYYMYTVYKSQSPNKKAKESPYISYKTAPLPQCPSLDGAEKGQNLVLKCRIPKHTFSVKENKQETNITITLQDS